jgi:cell division protein FtsB
VRGWLWIPALLGVAFTIAALDRDSGIASWLRLRGELSAARGRIAALDVEIAQLERAAEALQSDDFAIERAIREDLEYSRHGETIVRLPRSDHASPRFP